MSAKIDMLEVYKICRQIANDAIEKAKQSEDKKIDKTVYDVLTPAFNPIIEQLKSYLTMANDPYYGLFLMGMDIEVDYKIQGALDVIVKSDPFVLKINPLYALSYTFSQLTAGIIQEIFRINFEHPGDYSRLNPFKNPEDHDKLEKGSSASVSDMVQHDVRLDKDKSRRLNLPPDTYTTSKMQQETGQSSLKNESLDYNFKFLKKFLKDNNNKNGGNGNGSGEGKGDPQAASYPGNPNGDGKQTHDWYEEDHNKTKDRIRGYVRDIWKNMSEKARGEMPAGLVQQIEMMLKPPQENWRQRLKRFIGTIPFPYRSTKQRLNRRQPLRADLSGRLPKRLVKIVAVVDTSGSMSDKDIEVCLNELIHITKAQEAADITVIECDAQINNIYKVKKPTDIRTKVGGRGGTYFTPAIEHINNDKYFRDALLVFFTDGGGESSIPRPLTYKNLWVVLQDKKYLSVQEPYGDVIDIMNDETFKR